MFSFVVVSALILSAERGCVDQDSPGGAAVGSQGRQPLVREGQRRIAPEGRQYLTRVWDSVAPPGLGAPEPQFQGLTPLATNGRPSGAKSAPRNLPAQEMLALADPPAAEPPLVGRPLDWSGAVGGPFAVEMTAEPTELAAEEPLTLTLRITGRGNLSSLPRPALGKLESFKAFAVDDLDDRFL